MEMILRTKPCFEEYGPLYESGEALLLHRCDVMNDWASGPSSPDEHAAIIGGIYEEIGRWVALAVGRQDLFYFYRIARFVQARREGQCVHSIPYSEFGITPGPGRKLKPYDLKLTGPEAIHRIAENRYFSEPPNRARISKEEIRKKIHEVQKERGINAVKQIADSDLSRLITQMGIRKFMVKPSRKPKKL